MITSTIEKALSFYASNYALLGSWILKPDKREPLLGNLNARRCRFCGGRPPQASFKNKAHAVPESIGNKSLFTADECDRCNQSFGKGIENNFGNWSKPIRLIARISGGVPTIKEARENGWRIENGPTGLNLSHDSMDPVVTVDEIAKTMTFRLPRDPFVPRAVFKAFIKCGISLLPDSEISNIAQTVNWVSDPDHTKEIINSYKIRGHSVPGPPESAGLGLFILRRDNDYLRLPYLFLIMACGPLVFQISLPSKEKNWAIDEASFAGPLFPVHSRERAEQYGFPQPFTLDLSGTAVIKNSVETFVMSYDERLPV